MPNPHNLRFVAITARFATVVQALPAHLLCHRARRHEPLFFLQSVVGPHLERVLGKRSMKARQASARGGELQVDVDRGAGCVRAAGQAVIVLSGLLHL